MNDLKLVDVSQHRNGGMYFNYIFLRRNIFHLVNKVKYYSDFFSIFKSMYETAVFAASGTHTNPSCQSYGTQYSK